MRKYFCALCLSFCFLFVGCVSTSYNTLGKNDVITAYMQTGNIKYYMRPSKMTSENYKVDKSYLMIDFTYQMEKRAYVSDAYVNFTVYSKADAFIEKAYFLLPENKIIELSNISTLDRNTNEGYIRVTTSLEKQFIKDILENLQSFNAKLVVLFDNNASKKFIATKKTVERINEVFSK